MRVSWIQGEPNYPIFLQLQTHEKENTEIIKAPRASSSVSDIMCGVSNAVYRKEYKKGCVNWLR